LKYRKKHKKPFLIRGIEENCFLGLLLLSAFPARVWDIVVETIWKLVYKTFGAL
jgi:hypothetical protein